MKHKDIQLLLYEYADRVLPPDQNDEVARHLESCIQCRSDLSEITDVTSMLQRSNPADSRSEEFWQGLSDRIQQQLSPVRPTPVPLNTRIGLFWELYRHPALGITGAMAILMAVLSWQYFSSTPRAAFEPVPIPSTGLIDDAQSVHSYLRKSKALLVGISNMRSVEGQTFDLSAEQLASRELVKKSRKLREQSSMEASPYLIDNLERILIELANIDHPAHQSNLDLIREGIREENLLFKIRMAEAATNPGLVRKVGYNHGDEL